jgi:hypothetical protein
MAILGALPGKETFAAHEPGDAVTPPGTAQSTSQPWAAIGPATARKLVPDAFSEPGVFELARAGLAAALHPIVIAAA